MSNDLLRYSCQMALPGFSERGQKLLRDAKVLVIGAGGLGCPAAQYLAAAGVGTIGICDFDTVSLNNLHRQILYTPADIGRKKSIIAVERLSSQNPDISLITIDLYLETGNALQLINAYDLVLDCTDNFETRYLVNDACVLAGKPLIYGAIYQFEGQLAVWNVGNEDGTRSPNYRDLFPNADASQIPNCADGGVIPTLAGIIGCLQANEAIKYITGTGELLTGSVLIFDAQTLQSHKIKIGKLTRAHITKLPGTTSVPTISAEQLKKELADNNNVRLIDVRTTAERDLFDIGGEHIPLYEFESRTAHFDPNPKTVLYCATGKRSAEGVKLIKSVYPNANVFSLEGGLNSF